LSKSMQAYVEAVVDGMPWGVALFSISTGDGGRPNFVLTFCNESFARLTGRTPGTAQSELEDVFHERNYEIASNLLSRAFSTKQRQSDTLYSSIEKGLMEVSAFCCHSDRMAVLTMVDVSDRLDSVRELWLSFESQLAAAEISGVLMTDDDSSIDSALAKLTHVLRCDCARILLPKDDASALGVTHEWGTGDCRCWLPDRQKADDEHRWLLDAVAESGLVRLDSSKTTTCPPNPLECGRTSMIAAAMTVHGRLLGVLILCTDRSLGDWSIEQEHLLKTVSNTLAIHIDRLRANRALRSAEELARENERFVRSVLSSVPAHVAILDGDGIVQYVNRASTDWRSRFPWGRKPLQVGTNYPQLCRVCVQDTSYVGDSIADSIEEVILGQRESFQAEWPFDALGRQRWVRVSVRRFVGDGPTRVIVTHEDITEHNIRKEELARAQKLDSLGKLAAGIAHDFNNILQAIVGHAFIARENHELSEEAGNELAAIEKAAARASSLVRQIMTFTRQIPRQKEPVDLGVVARETAQLLSETIGRKINTIVHVEPETRLVHADETQMHQVLMNLCLNARDAMPGGGNLRIHVGNAAICDGFSQTHAWARAGEYVRITVSDDGCGMDDETKQHAFDPFYTTKSLHEGSGLGLSTTYGIVKAHDGLINIDTTPNQGTTVSVYVPSIPRRHIGASTEKATLTSTGRETLLLVDDETMIRDTVRRVLEMSGYSVLTAENGQDALDQFARHREEIDMVVLDLNMPRMDGASTLTRLREMWGKVKVLVATGLDASADNLIDTDLADGYLHKPFSPSELQAAIRTVLDGGS